MNRTATIALSGLAILLANAAAPVDAAIKCRKGLQYNSAAGGWIPSSYCGDELIAQVARSHGMKVSANDLRRSPKTKEDACMFAGADNRINHLCAGLRPEDFGSDID